MLKSLKNSQFARNVAILSSGTAIAQAIPIAVSPILTRIYKPEEFGLVALYVSCVAVVSVIATGRYEMAITLPASDIDAANIVTLTLKLCAAISVLLYIPIAIFGENIAKMLGSIALAPWLYLLPVSVMVIAVFNTFQYWNNRTLQYRSMSLSRIQNAGLTSSANVLFGIGRVSEGMLLGGLIGQLLSSIFISNAAWSQNKQEFKKTNRKLEWDLAKRYISHPIHILSLIHI